MGERKPVHLGEIQETLLIPLYGRAVESRKRRPMLHDPVAVAVTESLDYDFAKFDGGPSLIGSLLRTLMFDQWARDFLREHPAGTIIEVGCGMNTRFERLDNGRLHWVDVDLPDVIDLRRSYFADSARRRTIASSVLEPDWLEEVAAFPGPYLFLAEAVLVYLPEPEVRRALTLWTGRFPAARIALDTAGKLMIENQDEHDAMRMVTARMAWTCDDPSLLERWGLGLRLVDSRTLTRPATAARAAYRLLMPLVGVVLRGKMSAYRLNLYRGTG